MDAEKPELSEEDIDHLPVAVVRKMLRRMMAKKDKSRSELGEEAEDDAENEREDLADLHAEHKGKGPEIPVTDDDLPESLRADSDEAKPAKKDSKRSK
jgi:hypothetical protein